MMYGKLINRVFPRVFTDEEFARIKAPVLLVLGDHEVIYNDLEKTVAAAQRLVEGVEVEVIPGAHHITVLAQPELTNQRILGFLSTSWNPQGFHVQYAPAFLCKGSVRRHPADEHLVRTRGSEPRAGRK